MNEPRLTDEALEKMLMGLDRERSLNPDLVRDALLDLKDARLRIVELEALKFSYEYLCKDPVKNAQYLADLKAVWNDLDGILGEEPS